jgi:hypothetical protein
MLLIVHFNGVLVEGPSRVLPAAAIIWAGFEVDAPDRRVAPGGAVLRARKLAAQLQREGHEVGRRHVRTLMRRMGLRRCTASRVPASRRAGRRSTPYLLHKLPIERPNQVWSIDLIYCTPRRCRSPLQWGYVSLQAEHGTVEEHEPIETHLRVERSPPPNTT